ncbi:MAG: glycosyltransferase [bacterium]|nr:glycosyltransferase [bacterium]
MPAFNAGKFLANAINSVRNQTCQEWELIVVDDSSTDGTWEIARNLAETDSRISVIRQPVNAGVCAARNTAIVEARGKWVAFLDSDDIWLPEKLEKQFALSSHDTEANLLFTNYYLWDGYSDLGIRYSNRKKFPEGDVLRRLIFHNLFGASTVMVRYDAIQRAGGFDSQFRAAEDWDLWLRIAEEKLWARGVWQPLVRYRLWSGNTIKNTQQTAESNLSVLEKMLTRPSCRKQVLFKQSCAIARGNLEFARIRGRLSEEPDLLPGAAFRAWLHYPKRVKWLMWSVAASWPTLLGGRLLSSVIQKKVSAKW